MQQQPRHRIWIRRLTVVVALAVVWPVAGLAQGEGSGDLAKSETPVAKPLSSSVKDGGSKTSAPEVPAAAKPAAAKAPDTFACNYNDKTGALVECSCKNVEACISLDRSKQCGDAPIKNRPKGGGRCRP